MALSNAVIYSHEGNIATISLNRPKKFNSLDNELRQGLLASVQQASIDEAIRAVILTGCGKAFCAGGDITTMEFPAGPFTGKKRLEKGHSIVQTITNMEKPVIAAVNGYAVGAGCSLALACDIIVAAENAQFGQAFVRIGAVPDLGGAYFLARAVGLHRAKELIFSGRNIDAKEAERIGFVSRVVPPGELMHITVEIAAGLAKAPTKAIALAKQLLNRCAEMDLSTFLLLEGFAQSSAFQTRDFEEGVTAFLEKREAKFCGR